MELVGCHEEDSELKLRCLELEKQVQILKSREEIMKAQTQPNVELKIQISATRTPLALLIHKREI